MMPNVKEGHVLLRTTQAMEIRHEIWNLEYEASL